MLDERVRRRIEALNRAPLAGALQRACNESKPAPRHTPAIAGAPIVMPGLVRRGEVVRNDVGEHLRIVLSLDDLWPGGGGLVARRLAVLSGQGDLAELVAAMPDDALLLDLETCGLAGAALFLVGLLRTIDGRLAVELLWARDYSEEPAVLTSLWQRISETTVLATFNGKSFDWPMVLDRTARHLLFRGRRPPQPAHVDLLHPARRRWRDALPDCKLQTLETHICRRRRTGDIPGSQIPAAYKQYVRTGFEREMDAILLHNALDVATLLDLAMRLAE